MDKLKKFEDNDHRVVILTGAPVASAGQLNTSSLARLAERVKELLADPAALAGKKELIVAGPWTFSKDGMRIIEAKFGQLEIDTAAEDVEADEVRTGDLTRARSHSNAAQKGKADLKKHELEWSIAVNFIKQVLQKITDLQSFEWESDVPFSKELWPLVNPSLQHLTLNAFVPDGDTRTAHEPHPDYFTYDDLNHLCSFRSLKSLRIYGLVDSVQPIIWETAWRNPGLHTLELGMLLPPITRATDNKPMEVIDREWKFDPEHIGTTIYRGQDGSGMLHYLHGHGEYLDPISISKARAIVAPSVMGNLDALPIKTLRLANFVVDDMPFAKFFDQLEELVFIEKCCDAGFTLHKHLRDKVRIFARTKGYGSVEEGEVVEQFDISKKAE